MVCFYFIILLPLITATRRFDGSSYQSNIMDGDKPILRMSPNADYAESNSDEGRQTTPPPNTRDPALVRDLGLLVNWLMENFGSEVISYGRKNNNGVKESGKPILRMLLNDTTDSDSDKDDDDVSTEIEVTDPVPLTENPVTSLVTDSENDDDKLAPEVEITEPLPLKENPVNPSVDSENSDGPGSLRTKHKTKKHEEEKDANPKWLEHLKEFIKDLTTRYAQKEVLKHAKPVISSLEKKHKMKIKDIDVDEYGEIHINYVEKGKGKKTARIRKRSDET